MRLGWGDGSWAMRLLVAMAIGVLKLALSAALAAPVEAALPDEELPTDPLDAAVWDVEQGMAHLLVAAKHGGTLALIEAEREIVIGLLDGLEVATADGYLDQARYDRVFAAYEHVQGVFKDLPYRLIVTPGPNSRGFDLPLRRHPWLTLMERPLAGWRAERIESGARLTAIKL